MNKKLLETARFLENDICNLKREIEDLKYVIENYNKLGSNISFKSNSENNSKSFGSKKFNFKNDLKLIVEKILIQSEKELIKLKKEFKDLK